MNAFVCLLLLAFCTACTGSLFRSLGTSIFPLSRRAKLGGKLHLADHPLQIRTSYGKLIVQRNDGQAVYISDNNMEVVVQGAKAGPVRSVDQYTISCEGIFGVYKLPAGSYLAIIKHADSITISDIPVPGIKRVRSIELVKIPTAHSLAHKAHKANQTQVEIDQRNAEHVLLGAFKQHTFYYSTSGYDLTRTYQSNMLSQNTTSTATSGSQHTTHTTHTTSPTPTTHPSYHTTDWSNIEEKFCWNLNTAAPFLEANCTSLITPVVNAFIESTNMTHNGEQYTFTLISRRSRRRQGPRYIKRGSDELGDVANFAESEQILQRVDGTASSSFVQIRGSIPLFWTQPADWKLRPPVFLPPTNSGISGGTNAMSGSGTSGEGCAGGMSAHASALKTHLCDIVSSYFVPLWGGNIRSANASAGTSGTKGGHTHSTTISTVKSAHSIYMINLIDKKGVQGKLGELWQRVMYSVGNSTSTSGSVFPRYGYYHDAVCGNTVTKTKSARSSKSNATSVDDSTVLDRNATTHCRTTMGVSIRDMLTLHTYRNSSGIVESTTNIGTKLGTVHSTPNTTHTVPIKTHLLWFDYHHKCRRNPFATIDIYNTIESAIRSGVGYGVYTHNTTSPPHTLPTLPTPHTQHTPHTSILSTEQHIVRTNCMDCLDRTNVVQSIVSRWVLVRQLAALGNINTSVGSGGGSGVSAAQLKADHSSTFVLPDKRMESEFRRLWTENGDHLSVMYAGSRAMKRDVTRGGRRTRQGTLGDAVAGAQRFFMNNVRDKHRQLAVDVLLGLGEYGVLSKGGSGGGGGGSGDGGGTGGGGIGGDRRVLHLYAPLSYRLARMKQLLSKTFLSPRTSTASTPATTANTRSGSIDGARAALSSARVTLSTSKGVKLVKRTRVPGVRYSTSNNNTSNATEVTINTNTTTTTTTGTTPGTTTEDKVLGVLGRKLDSLFDEWLREIPQLKSGGIDRKAATATVTRKEVVKDDKVKNEMKRGE